MRNNYNDAAVNVLRTYKFSQCGINFNEGDL